VARALAAPVLERLDRIERRLDALESSIATGEQVRALSDRVDQRTDWLWASKVTTLGDRVLVGCRHLGLNYLFPADDQLLMPQFVVHGEYETLTTNYLLRELPEDAVCLDVGANVGYYSCLMARRAWRGRTIAFEADPTIHEILRANVAINWCEKVVDARNMAVSDRTGTLTLHRRPGRSGNTSVTRISEDERLALGELDRLDVVKIDVEGAESMVLAGMSGIVERFNPLIIMEWSPEQAEQAGSSAAGLGAAIESLRLTAHVFEAPGTIRPVSADELASLGYQNIALRRT
jgi:FkbM family methyltransferase